MIVSEDNKPPVGGMGGSVHDWKRGLDPFHSSAFPDEFKPLFSKGKRSSGWLGLDWVGNIIAWVPDGTEIKDV